MVVMTHTILPTLPTPRSLISLDHTLAAFHAIPTQRLLAHIVACASALCSCGGGDNRVLIERNLELDSCARKLAGGRDDQFAQRSSRLLGPGLDVDGLCGCSIVRSFVGGVDSHDDAGSGKWRPRGRLLGTGGGIGKTGERARQT
jgi:hypothetical protein